MGSFSHTEVIGYGFSQQRRPFMLNKGGRPLVISVLSSGKLQHLVTGDGLASLDDVGDGEASFFAVHYSHRALVHSPLENSVDVRDRLPFQHSHGSVEKPVQRLDVSLFQPSRDIPPDARVIRQLEAD